MFPGISSIRYFHRHIICVKIPTNKGKTQAMTPHEAGIQMIDQETIISVVSGLRKFSIWEERDFNLVIPAGGLSSYR